MAKNVGWKWAVRNRVWDILHAKRISPGCHNRIPNFVGAEEAAKNLASLPEFKNARCIKIDPDSAQKEVRFLALTAGKTIVVPRPRMADGFCSVICPDSIPVEKYREACTLNGSKKYGSPLELDHTISIDLMVSGAVAVNPENGFRLGKGKGYADIEYAILKAMHAIDDSVVVVASIHDEQIVADLPSEKVGTFDVGVDVIVTPTQVIRVKQRLPRPAGIMWGELKEEQVQNIEILQKLKQQQMHHSQGPS
ncbi:hypothetical protein BSKO_13613 [Bryopsis sp. KO-2023]|nr:hypothetical protein BSKO_13613 [Bryopsis sp. KO-2023]